MTSIKYTVIKDEEQYWKYCNILEELVFSDSEKHEDEIELLTLLIDTYQDQQSKTTDLDPVQILNSLMEDHQITNAQLAKEIGVSRSLISDIRNRKKGISKEMVYKLSERFKMRPEAFLESEFSPKPA